MIAIPTTTIQMIVSGMNTFQPSRMISVSYTHLTLPTKRIV